MYAKLIENKLTIAPRRVVIGDTQVFNPAAEQLEALGYKLVVFTEPPEAPEGYYAESGWTEAEDAITQTWTLVELPPEEPSAGELLDIILGGIE